MRDVLSRHLDAGYVPGAVAVVARHGEVHIEALGTLAFEGEGTDGPAYTAQAGTTTLPRTMATILMIQRAPAPAGLPILFDPWTAAYQAIDD